jgi:predicted RNA binding protein YcfA (HicA-like mRNA interferase family)
LFRVRVTAFCSPPGDCAVHIECPIGAAWGVEQPQWRGATQFTWTARIGTPGRRHVNGESPGSAPPSGGRGWQLKAIRGRPPSSIVTPKKGIVVTEPGHPGKDVPIGTLKAILCSAGLEGKEKD